MDKWLLEIKKATRKIGKAQCTQQYSHSSVAHGKIEMKHFTAGTKKKVTIS
jgi:hypothetical protein